MPGWNQGCGPIPPSRRATVRFSIGGVRLSELAARFGTPLYVLDTEEVRRRCRTYRAALPDAEVAYAGKALLTKAVARLVAEEGLSLDVCSGGEAPAGAGRQRCWSARLRREQRRDLLTRPAGVRHARERRVARGRPSDDSGAADEQVRVSPPGPSRRTRSREPIGASGWSRGSVARDPAPPLRGRRPHRTRPRPRRACAPSPQLRHRSVLIALRPLVHHARHRHPKPVVPGTGVEVEPVAGIHVLGDVPAEDDHRTGVRAAGPGPCRQVQDLSVGGPSGLPAGKPGPAMTGPSGSASRVGGCYGVGTGSRPQALTMGCSCR